MECLEFAMIETLNIFECNCAFRKATVCELLPFDDKSEPGCEKEGSPVSVCVRKASV